MKKGYLLFVCFLYSTFMAGANDLGDLLWQDVCDYNSCYDNANVQKVKNLLEAGADPNWSFPTAVPRISPLFLAMSDESNQKCSLLIDHGADVNEVGYFGWSPLMVATFTLNDTLRKKLLDAGAYEADSDFLWIAIKQIARVPGYVENECKCRSDGEHHDARHYWRAGFEDLVLRAIDSLGEYELCNNPMTSGHFGVIHCNSYEKLKKALVGVLDDYVVLYHMLKSNLVKNDDDWAAIIAKYRSIFSMHDYFTCLEVGESWISKSRLSEKQLDVLARAKKVMHHRLCIHKTKDYSLAVESQISELINPNDKDCLQSILDELYFYSDLKTVLLEVLEPYVLFHSLLLKSIGHCSADGGPHMLGDLFNVGSISLEVRLNSRKR